MVGESPEVELVIEDGSVEAGDRDSLLSLLSVTWAWGSGVVFLTESWPMSGRRLRMMMGAEGGVDLTASWGLVRYFSFIP